jgi:uncharacterized protein (TIGR02145 family)
MALTEEEILKCIELFNKYSDSNVPLVYDINTKALVNEAYAKFSYDRVKNSTMGANDTYSLRCINFVKNLWKLLMKWLLDWIIPAPVLPPLLDRDGNEYTTVTIGTQEWIVENFKSTKYADGSPINNVTIDGVYYGGWFLPSKDELNLMQTNLAAHLVGNFVAVGYWSSSEYALDAINGAYMQYVGGSGNSFVVQKRHAGSNYAVRACRTFNSSVIYNIRDRGPANGWIFNIISLGGGVYKYYEAAEFNQIEGIKWSSTLSTVGTSTGIGTGLSNTNAIVAKGYTESAGNYAASYTYGTGWTGATEGAYCWYNNDETTYKNTYGALYNWHATSNLAYLERNGIQEIGWRVPNEDDVLELFHFLDPAWEDNGVSPIGGYLKEIGITHWNAPNVGATNSSGFTAIGAGVREYSNGLFLGLKSAGAFWSSTGLDSTNGLDYTVSSSSAAVGAHAGGYSKKEGMSVRLVRGSAPQSRILILHQ